MHGDDENKVAFSERVVQSLVKGDSLQCLQKPVVLLPSPLRNYLIDVRRSAFCATEPSISFCRDQLGTF